MSSAKSIYRVAIRPNEANVAPIVKRVKASSPESAIKVAERWLDTNDNHIARLAIKRHRERVPAVRRELVRFEILSVVPA